MDPRVALRLPEDDKERSHAARDAASIRISEVGDGALRLHEDDSKRVMPHEMWHPYGSMKSVMDPRVPLRLPEDDKRKEADWGRNLRRPENG